MRTNIDIDDALLREAMEATGQTTKKATVEEALRKLVHLHRQREIRQLRGRVDWEGDLKAWRDDRSPDEPRG